MYKLRWKTFKIENDFFPLIIKRGKKVLSSFEMKSDVFSKIKFTQTQYNLKFLIITPVPTIRNVHYWKITKITFIH